MKAGAAFIGQAILSGGESVPLLGSITKTIELIMEVAEKKKNADNNMMEVAKCCGNVSGVVFSMVKRKIALDTSIRTNLVDLGDLLDEVETITRRYNKKSWAGKMWNGSKYDGMFEKLLQKVRDNVRTLNLALTADTHEIATGNAAALGENAAALHGLKEGQDKIAAKKEFKDHEEHTAIIVLSEAEISQGDIKYLESTHFAEGGFGKVWKGRYAGEKVAVKKVDLKGQPEADRSAIRSDFISELGIMYKLRHPCIVAVLGACTSVGDELALVMEMVERGDLRGLLDKEGETITMETRCSILYDIALGMAYLYGLKPTPVMHRDLKSLNVLITLGWRGKVSDFGLAKKDTSKIFSNASANTSRGRALGTARWKAPEQFGRKKPPFNERSDVYSYGIVIWETLTGRVPFEDVANEDMAEVVKSDGERPSPRPARGTDEKIVELMQRCWAQKNEERPSFDEIKEVMEEFGGVERQRSGTFERKARELQEREESLQREQERRKESNARREREMEELRAKYEKEAAANAQKEKEMEEVKAKYERKVREAREEEERKAKVKPPPPPNSKSGGGGVGSRSEFASNELKEEGNVLLKAEKREEAIAKYNQAIELWSGNVAAINNKCLALIKTEKFEEGEKAARDVLKIEPENVKAMFRLACSIVGRGEKAGVEGLSEAMELFQRSVELGGGGGEKCKERALCLRLINSIKKENPRHENATTMPKKSGAKIGLFGLKFTSNEQLKEAAKEWVKDKQKAKGEYGKIEDWDVSEVTSFERLFEGANGFNEDLSRWDVSEGTNMQLMFYQCSFFNSDLSKWDTSNCTNFYGMFASCKVFSGDLCNWNTGKCTNMSGMFEDCPFFNSDISAWNTAKCRDMSAMFNQCQKFQSDASSWDTSNCTDMHMMFNGASSFNSDLSKWDTAKCTNMKEMFKNSYSFHSDLSQWSMSSVKNNDDMFAYATAMTKPLRDKLCPKGEAPFVWTGKFEAKYQLSQAVKEWMKDKEKAKGKYGPIEDWDVSEVTSFKALFEEAKDFNEDLSRWDVSNVTDMSWMFTKASSFNSDLSKWDTSKCTDMRNMFLRASSFNSDLSKWDTSNCTSMQGMFCATSSFNSDLSKWGTSNCENMSHMFQQASSFNSDLSKWDTSKCTDMRYMFQLVFSFNSDLSKWDTSNCTNLSQMFNEASSFNSDLSKWDTSNCTNFYGMFHEAFSFNSDLSEWDTSKCTDMRWMFNEASSFNSDLSKWDTKKSRGNMEYMFKGASKIKNRRKPKPLRKGWFS